MSLRGAVVGVGYLGNFHAQKYKASPLVELIGVCDPFVEQAQKIAQSLGVTAFTNPKDLVGKVDVVTIASTTKTHYELAKFFLSEGIHVNVEKPMTETVEQARELLELAAKNSLTLSVGHIERFNPSLQELRNRLKNLKSLELIRHATFKPRGADVSVLHDLMIHDIDLLYWLTKSEVQSFHIQAQSVVSKEADAAQAFFVMKNGIQASISVSRVAPSMERRVRAYETHQSYYVDSGLGIIERTWSPSSHPAGVATEAPASVLLESKIEKIEVQKQDALQLETNDFLEAVLKKRPPTVTAVDGLKALELVEELTKAIHGRK